MKRPLCYHANKTNCKIYDNTSNAFIFYENVVGIKRSFGKTVGQALLYKTIIFVIPIST